MLGTAKVLALAACFFALHAETKPQAMNAVQPRLYGLKKIAVTISADPDADLDRPGVQASVESKLRSAGIRVDKGSRSQLNVIIGVSLIRSRERLMGFAYSIHLGLTQQVYLAHNPNRLTQAVTWQTMSLGTSSADELAADCERVIAREINEFVSVYRASAER